LKDGSSVDPWSAANHLILVLRQAQDEDEMAGLSALATHEGREPAFMRVAQRVH
jgi:hypothetical protein